MASPSTAWDAMDAVRHLTEVDARLGLLMARAGACQIRSEAKLSPYASLGRAIVYQQLSGKAAGTILGRFKQRFGRGRFPAPQVILQAGEAEMRAVGLSRNKTLALKDLAQHKLAGHVPTLRQLHTMEDDRIVERLVAIRGIGRWTVEMMLIFHLGRPDVLPVDDYGVRKGFAKLYRKRRLPTPHELAHYGRRWRPYRSVASWYLWRALEETES